VILERLREIGRQHRDDAAIIDGDRRMTYGDLLQRIDVARGRLERALTPEPGAVIAASLGNSWQFVACFFAVAELGGVFMPCNPQWRAPELRWFARRLGFRAIITEPAFRAAWEEIREVLPRGSVVTVDEVTGGGEAGGAGSGATRAMAEDAPALYLSTSGSTGTPRIVIRSRGNLLAGARNVARGLGIGPGRRFLSAVPFHHANGFSNCLLMPLLSGATIVPVRQFTPGACAELIRRERVDVLIGSPVIYALLLDGVADGALLSSLELCFSAGARMPEMVAELWRKRFGLRVRQWYGTTETGVVSIDRVGDEPRPGAEACVGAPVPGVEVECLDPDGNALGPRVTGELAVRSPTLMSGYAGEPESSQRALHRGFFRTGDIGQIDAEGNLYLSGRVRGAINVAGVKVDPVEVERAVEALPGVSACRVDAVASPKEGEVIRARIVVDQGLRMTRRDVIEQCRRQLAEYKLPRIVEFVESVSATLAGKTPAEWTVGDGGR
jgi:long-chain acyl-CoA synthetase